MRLRGYLGLAAHHKREMRIMNRVLTWRSEARRDEMITHEGDLRHVDLLLRDHGLEHGKSQGKTVPWDMYALLAKNPLAIAPLAN